MFIKSNFIQAHIFFPYFKEKYKNTPISLFMDYTPSMEDLNQNPYNFIILHEPNEFFGIHNWVYDNANYFSAVLTYNSKLLNNLPNAIKFNFGVPNTDDKEYFNSFKHKQKDFEISFLSGMKDISQGHKLRQEVYKLENSINIPKKWFKVLDDFDHEKGVRPGYGEYSKSLSSIPKTEAPEQYGKRFLFNDSMFHIVIENVKVDNWYTEKLIQAFNTKTLPLFWGCDNLNDEGYDEKGIIRFNTSEELLNIINNLTEKDYTDRLPYINHNYKLSLKDNFKNKLEDILDWIIKENKI